MPEFKGQNTKNHSHQGISVHGIRMHDLSDTIFHHFTNNSQQPEVAVYTRVYLAFYDVS